MTERSKERHGPRNLDLRQSAPMRMQGGSAADDALVARVVARHARDASDRTKFESEPEPEPEVDSRLVVQGAQTSELGLSRPASPTHRASRLEPEPEPEPQIERSALGGAE